MDVPAAVTDAVSGALDTAYAQGKADQALTDAGALTSAQNALDAANQTVATTSDALSKLQAKYDAYVASHPDATPPPPPAAKPLLGGYMGGDDQFKAVFGRYPEIAQTYYQANQVGNIVIAEKARIDRGIVPLITLTTKGTQYLADVANGSGTGYTLVQSYVATLTQVAAYANAKGLACYATLDHEWEAKVNQGLLTGGAADPATYGKALSNFYALANQAPGLTTLYWCAGSNTAKIGAVTKAITTLPDAWSFNPYSSSSHSTAETFGGLVAGKLKTLKATLPAALAALPVGISETGANHTDAQMASGFLSDLNRATLKAQGLIFASLFNHADGSIVVSLTQAAYPKSVAAYAAALAG